MMTEELKKERKEIKFRGVEFGKKLKRYIEKVKEERSKAGKYKRKES